jgi:hypothetical protein
MSQQALFSRARTRTVLMGFVTMLLSQPLMKPI